ncbi:putative holin-like toxin [Alkalihalophilus pseudofirmus]|uniref:Holin-like toxin n=1 Tax=Alkalihalophilus pseudofirmus TaxID=79885 RepID=A0AAJ2NPW7_ALKPS|nr:putative holin-like toxin [Alkalihalophilus pseudofirmus]MDV2886414.1 putative holin-like toxin [Alkalihalophilus pseudofirmus]
MTTYESFSLIAQISLVLIAILTMVISIVVYLNKKK